MRHTFLSNCSPIIQPHDGDRLELPFTSDELEAALNHLGKGKSPGWDGLLVEIFMTF